MGQPSIRLFDGKLKGGTEERRSGEGRGANSNLHFFSYSFAAAHDQQQIDQRIGGTRGSRRKSKDRGIDEEIRTFTFRRTLTVFAGPCPGSESAKNYKLYILAPIDRNYLIQSV